MSPIGNAIRGVGNIEVVEDRPGPDRGLMHHIPINKIVAGGDGSGRSSGQIADLRLTKDNPVPIRQNGNIVVKCYELIRGAKCCQGLIYGGEGKLLMVLPARSISR